MNSALTSIDFAALSPLFILLLGALVMLLVESFGNISIKRGYPYLNIGFILLALAAAFLSPVSSNPLLTPWISFDPLARFFTIFFLWIGLAFTLLSTSLFQRSQVSQGEYYFLSLSSLFGLVLIGAAADFLTLFLGIEILAISLYVFCGYMKSWKTASEASLKYFLMGALATSFLLYGIALIYGAVGTTQLSALLPSYQNIWSEQHRLFFLAGAALVTLGLAFEAAVIPFQLWAPDVYAGASTPVTAFMAIGTKVGAFAAFIRVFMIGLPDFDPLWNQAVAWLAYPTLIYANFVALKQTQLRRFFAYSGISHAGFLLIPLAAGTVEALPSLLFYLVVYALATAGAFAVMAFLDFKNQEVQPQGVMLEDLHGLFRKSPLLAGILTLCLLTLAGIPPTAGFFAKFYIFKVAFAAKLYGLVIVGLLTSILAAYYYLRMIGLMFAEGEPEETPSTRSISAGILGVSAALSILFLSIYPQPLLDLIEQLNSY